MKKKKAALVVGVIVVAIVAVILAVVGRKIYIQNLKENAKISIDSVSVVTDLSKDAWWQNVLGQTADVLLPDAQLYGIELSETEQQMQYDLNRFNVYQVDIVVQNATEDMEYMITPLLWCKENAYIWVEDDAGLRVAKVAGSSTISAVYFVSKTYTPEDVEQYLKTSGMPVYVSINKNDIHEITSYNEQIYFKD